MSDKELLIIILVSLIVGFIFGFSLGMSTSEDIKHKVDCVSQFRGKPANTVTAECIKYFK